MAKWIAPLGVVAVVVAGGFVLHHRTRTPDRFPQALAALRENDLERVAEIEAALSADPQFAEQARFLRGAILLRKREYGSAYAEFSQIVPEGELREPLLELTGEALYRLGRLAEAEPILRELATENPDHVNAHRWLGSIYYNLGANDLAIAELSTVARLVPGDYRPHWLIAEMYFDFEQNRQAISSYRSALSRSPSPAVRQVILRKLARALIAEREFPAALDALKDCAINPDVLALTSECHWSLGDRTQADKALQQARDMNPDDRAVLYLHARMLIGDGRAGEAIPPLQRILKRNPLDAQCRYQLALAYRRLGKSKESDAEMARWKESKALWEKLTQLNIKAIREPANARVRDELADVCTKLNKPKLAAVWRKAAEAIRALRGGKAGKSEGGP